MSARTVLKSSFWRMPPAGILLGLAVLSLTFLGLVILFSATRSMYDDPTILLKKQLIWLVIATFAGVLTYMVDLNKLRPYVFILGGGAVLILLLVLIPGIGVKVNGAQRWIDLGPMRLQASELAGVAFCDGALPGNESTFFWMILFEAMWCPVAFWQCCVGSFLLSPTSVRLSCAERLEEQCSFSPGAFSLIPTTVAAIALFCLAVYHDPVRLQRITSFLDVEGNRNDSSYQLWRNSCFWCRWSARGWLGRGASTDVIFAGGAY